MESAKPSVYTGGNQEGMDRVLKEDGGYAFFMEEAALKYYMDLLKICKGYKEDTSTLHARITALVSFSC